jgi:hypothetical protein
MPPADRVNDSQDPEIGTVQSDDAITQQIEDSQDLPIDRFDQSGAVDQAITEQSN